MIKILPLEENKFNVEPYYRLVICLGYGEHCDDTFTRSHIEINDEKAIKYDSLSEEEMDEMDFFELDEISDCITVKDAEEIVRFINSLWKRKDKNGYNINHMVGLPTPVTSLRIMWVMPLFTVTLPEVLHHCPNLR